MREVALRRRPLVAAGVFCLVVAVGASAAMSARGAATATDALPDLGMARLSDIHVDKTPDGRRLLRYSTVIVNVGSGPFELRGARASSADTTMAISQRIYDGAGGYRDVPVTGTSMYYAGDGHNHWHVRDLESTSLIRLDNGVKVGTSTKHGFCFWDNTSYRLALPGAPQAGVYNGCGNSGSLAVTVGLSIGWGDLYGSTLPDQDIDITGLGAGRYRLQSTADAQGWFSESSTLNNTTWVDLQLKANGASIRIEGYGPSA